MSKIGKLPVNIPAGVKVDLQKGNELKVTGPKGSLSRQLHESMTIDVKDNAIEVKRPSESRKHKALHGLTRTLVYNMVAGVTQGFSRELEMVGVGYRAEMRGPMLILHAGYSHPVLLRPPEGVTIQVEAKENKITVSGIDKELVGATAAKIRSVRRPEPYKGKGIKYVDETIRRKAGKAAGGK
jgi:large subunit ribosomal protein L6